MQAFLGWHPLFPFSHRFICFSTLKEIENSSLSSVGSNAFSCDCQSLMGRNRRLLRGRQNGYKQQFSSKPSSSFLQSCSLSFPASRQESCQLSSTRSGHHAWAAAQTSKTGMGSKKEEKPTVRYTRIPKPLSSPKPSAVSN